MPNAISGLLLPDMDINKLKDVSQQWITSVDKKSKLTTKMDVVSALYDGILHLLDSGYSYTDIVNKLKDELQFSITSHTLKRYLQDIKDVRLKAQKEIKKAETKAKQATARSLKSLPSINTITIDSTVESSSSLPDISDLNSSKQTLVSSPDLNLSTTSVNTEIISSEEKSIVPKLVNQSESSELNSVTSNKKSKSSKSKSVVPKLVPSVDDNFAGVELVESLPINSLPVDKDDPHSSLTPSEKALLKHYNKY